MGAGQSVPAGAGARGGAAGGMGPTVLGRAVQVWGLASEVALVGALVGLLAVPFAGGVPAWLPVGRLLSLGLSQAVLPAAVMLKRQQSRGGPREFEDLAEPTRSFTWFAGNLGLWPTCVNYLAMDVVGARAYFSLVWEDAGGSGAKIFLGGAPWTFHMADLRRRGVRAAVNCCEEWDGGGYAAHGIEQLRLNCVDFCDVPEAKLASAVAFVHGHVAQGHSVYIHCKAGVGRSTAVAVSYLASRVEEFKGRAGGMLLGESANRHIKARRPPAAAHMYARPSTKAFLAGAS